MKPAAYLVTLPPGRIPAQSVLIDAARASDYAAQHHGRIDALVLQREANEIWQVMVRQSILLGEASKSLDANDPLMEEIQECWRLMDAASNPIELVWRSPESPLDKLTSSIGHAFDECPVNDVLGVLMGHLVGMVVEISRRKGYDSTGAITIDGGTSRDITIHAAKQPQGTTEKVKS